MSQQSDARAANSTVFACPTYDTEVPLGNSQIVFRSGHLTYRVAFDPATGALVIDAENGRLAVYPTVTNSITVKQERY